MSKIDLHTHTNNSDGALSPSELVLKAKENGITTLSITDHDSVNALNEAMEVGKDIGVNVIPGVELSTDIEDREVHLLGLFLDIDNDELKKYLSFFRDERLYRAKRIIKKLNMLGHSITIDDVLDHAQNSAIGRPHIAFAMINRRIVSNYSFSFR